MAGLTLVWLVASGHRWHLDCQRETLRLAGKSRSSSMVALLDLAEFPAEATKEVYMGKDPAAHGRPSIVLFLKRIWAKVLPLLKNQWTLRIAFGFFRILIWMAKKFDWF
jgi:hypothetical protein